MSGSSKWHFNFTKSQFARMNKGSKRPTLKSAPTTEPCDGFTAREREVVDLVWGELPDKAIAQELGISEHTVGTHLRRMLSKTRCRTRAGLALSWERSVLARSRLQSLKRSREFVSAAGTGARA